MKLYAAVILSFILVLPELNAAAPRVAVVTNRYDNVEKWLQACRVPYRSIGYAELENAEVYSRFDAIFFPSGMEPPPETNINILSRGTSIQGVTLKEGHYRLDRRKLARALRSFIDGGGSAYFSGYSWDILHGAYGGFDFFHDFPYIGSAGPVELRPEGDLRCFVSSSRIPAHMGFTGWVAARSIDGADILATAGFDTPRGGAEGPMVARLRKKRGEAYFTSFYAGEIGNQVMRFLVLRVAYGRLLEWLEESAGRWDQSPGAAVVDMLLPGETSRRYSVPLERGRNTVFLGSPGGHFQADLYRGDEILASRQSWERVTVLDVRVPEGGTYGLRVFPAGNGRAIPFAVSVKHGPRLISYFRRVILGFLFVSVIAALVLINRFMNPRKYSGRAR